MCGIAGFMARHGHGTPWGQSPTATLDLMAGALGHRGPDGRGDYQKANVAMTQVRLAIIDLSTGDQPLYEPGGAALIANGEIYNYVELRAEIGVENFATGSDCEPPLFLYRQHGLDFPLHLRGMYAIALHDPAEGRLVLTRDPFGIKPLYYAEAPDGFAFASEPQALIAAGIVAATLNPQSRDELVELQFTTGRDTPFMGIYRLQPGETLVVVDGRIVERRRLAALPAGGPVAQSEDEALVAVEQALADSVAVHCRADVPYGLFLSGGIDSSLVLSFMAEHSKAPVATYTVGFDGTDAADERQDARRLAESLGARHTEVGFTDRDFWTLLPAVAAAMDDPAADYACLPTFKLAQAAAKDVKVVLSGEGGDELFAGYGRYRSVLRPWWLGGRMVRGRGIVERMGLLRYGARGWRDGITAAELTEAAGGRSRLQVAQAVDCADWLPNDLLAKLDRCLMAHGLEGRTPFLDPKVAEAAFLLPDRLKIADGRGKYLLRRLLAKRVPAAPALAAKKGFTVPVGDWIAARGDRLAPLLAGDPGIAEFADPAKVEALFRDLHRGRRDKHGDFAAWTLLFYALWHRRHLRGLKPAAGQDAVDVLASRE